MNNTEKYKPKMSKKEILYIEGLLLSFGNKNIEVLEWGSGSSTVYFPHFLSTQDIEYEWALEATTEGGLKGFKADVTTAITYWNISGEEQSPEIRHSVRTLYGRYPSVGSFDDHGT